MSDSAMSLYYGQPSYGANHFSQPPMPNSYPLPPTIFQMDPATFRRDFANRLAELTVNSRPIIQGLSMMAHDYSRFAEIVAQCIEAHIRRVPPWVKLPSFYLLDMISKNIYEPYARQFARFVVPLFVETYEQVDEATRSKMVELVLTWRTGSPTGKELFGVPVQVSIERSIWGDGSSSSSNGFYSGVGQITKAQVLSELEFTLGQKERAVASNPGDLTSRTHVSVLQQLRKIVEAGVSQAELQQILNQLRNLMRSNPPPPPPVAPPAPQWAASTSYSAPPPPPVSTAALPPPSTFNVPSSYPLTPFKAEDHPISLTPSTSSAPTPVPAAANGPGFADLLSTLMKAGVMTANSTPTGAGATAKEEANAVKVEGADHERKAARAYRASIMSHAVQLTTSGITKSRPPINDLLYEQFAAQCKQCGIRFPDTTDGKKELEDHLDMHFRQNLKANQNIGRGHSRSWFVAVEDWVQDVKGKGRADGSRPLNVKAAAVAEAAQRDAKLRSEFVVVSPGDEAKSISCPICKEPFKSEFVEDDEEWVWKNATRKEDRVYHATCHAEASSNLLARLRSEANSRSRSGTPESVQSRTPPMTRLSLSPDSKHRGIKRKVDDDPSSVSGEADGTPQYKKLALAAL